MRTTEWTRLAPAFLLLLPLGLSTPSPASAQDDSRADETTTRTYYVAAERVSWDYAPTGKDRVTGARFDTTTARYPGVPDSVGRADPREGRSVSRYVNAVDGDYAPGIPEEQEGIGATYRKVLFRAYTDSTFTERVERPPEWEHLGMLGPVLRAEVGDTIRVVFRNRADRRYSMHPHGVSYEKDSEGKAYRDGTSGADREDDAVPPGGTHTYVWPVPERAGPGPNDPSSVLWMYHSHVHEDEDIATGLVGPMIVTRRGMAGPDGTPKDVDREFVTMYFHVSEDDSWRYPTNVDRHTDLPVDSAVSQPLFGISNEMSSINGYVYANMPVMTMREGERVRWYVFSGPNFADEHTVHWHANTALVGGHRTDMISIGPMMMAVADMVPDNPGTWLYHCHVDFHFKLGMSALYEVLPADGEGEVAGRAGDGGGR